MGKKILIIGGIARDHALAWKFAQSPVVEEVFVAPGNPGVNSVATQVDIAVDAYDQLIAFAKEKAIDLAYVSGDDQLGDGLVDLFEKAGIRAFGPSKAAARIEASKAFSKDFMKGHGIPTAAYETFDEYEKAVTYLAGQSVPIVIKASGLAGGKGAVICHTANEAETTLREMMQDNKFGAAGNEVVIEEFMSGPEISIHAFSDGTNYVLFPPAQDHKAALDGNKGLNTGGMGVVAPLSGVSEELMVRIEKEIVAPVIDGMRAAGTPFVGVLYPGIMLTDDGPKVLEYNARLGDPETQAYLRLLEADLMEVVEACLDGTLDQVDVRWSGKTAVNIVLASGGYPAAYEKGKVISGIEKAEGDGAVIVFHAGTALESDRLVTSGGRVLSVSAIGDDLDDALEKAYAAADRIQFEGKALRHDIGKAHDNSKLAKF